MEISSNNNIAQAIFQLLSRKNLLEKASDIIGEVQTMVDAQNGKIVAKVGSARILDEKTKMHLKQILSKRYSAKEIVLKESVDVKFLGGVRIEVNDDVLDLTLQNKIGKLQKYLTMSR